MQWTSRPDDDRVFQVLLAASLRCGEQGTWNAVRDYVVVVGLRNLVQFTRHELVRDDDAVEEPGDFEPRLVVLILVFLRAPRLPFEAEALLSCNWLVVIVREQPEPELLLGGLVLLDQVETWKAVDGLEYNSTRKGQHLRVEQWYWGNNAVQVDPVYPVDGVCGEIGTERTAPGISPGNHYNERLVDVVCIKHLILLVPSAVALLTMLLYFIPVFLSPFPVGISPMAYGPVHIDIPIGIVAPCKRVDFWILGLPHF